MDDSPLGAIGIEKIGSKPKTREFYPFSYSLLDSTKDYYCWHCLKKEVTIKCATCKIASFCSADCAKEGEIDHKYECSAIQKNPGLNVEERMLIRIVGRYKDIINENDKTIKNFYFNRKSERTIMQLWSHTEEMKKCKRSMDKFNRLYDSIKKYGDEKYLLDRQTTFELHCRNYINRHSISNKDYLLEIGKGLYLDLCRYDHSCRPNTIYSCNGTVASLRALHDGVDFDNYETTRYTYIDMPLCKIQRKHMLKETWFFDCNCDRCIDPMDNWLTSVICPKCLSEKNISKALKIHGEEAYADDSLNIICDNCKCVVEREYVIRALESMRSISQTIDSAPEITEDANKLLQIYQGILISYESLLPLCNSYMCQIIAAMIPQLERASMTKRERFLSMIDLHVKCEPFVRYVYRYAHPAKSMHLLQLSRLFFEIGNLKEASRYAIESHRIMDYLFDKDHHLTRQTKQTMELYISRLLNKGKSNMGSE